VARDDAGPLSTVLDTLFGRWRSALSLRLSESQVDHLLSSSMNSLTAGLHKVRFRWRTGAIFAVSLALSSPGVITLSAAAHAQVLQGYHHAAWTSENGVGAVWAVQQAPNGFLWLTTPTGVFRFDGRVLNRSTKSPIEKYTMRTSSLCFCPLRAVFG
jgi:hypothetical protein